MTVRMLPRASVSLYVPRTSSASVWADGEGCFPAGAVLHFALSQQTSAAPETNIRFKSEI